MTGWWTKGHRYSTRRMGTRARERVCPLIKRCHFCLHNAPQNAFRDTGKKTRHRRFSSDSRASKKEERLPEYKEDQVKVKECTHALSRLRVTTGHTNVSSARNPCGTLQPCCSAHRAPQIFCNEDVPRRPNSYTRVRNVYIYMCVCVCVCVYICVCVCVCVLVTSAWRPAE